MKRYIFLLFFAIGVLIFISWNLNRNLEEKTELSLNYKALLEECQSKLLEYEEAPVLSIYEPEGWKAIKVPIDESPVLSMKEFCEKSLTLEEAGFKKLDWLQENCELIEPTDDWPYYECPDVQ